MPGTLTGGLGLSMRCHDRRGRHLTHLPSAHTSLGPSAHTSLAPNAHVSFGATRGRYAPLMVRARGNGEDIIWAAGAQRLGGNLTFHPLNNGLTLPTLLHTSLGPPPHPLGGVLPTTLPLAPRVRSHPPHPPPHQRLLLDQRQPLLPPQGHVLLPERAAPT